MSVLYKVRRADVLRGDDQELHWWNSVMSALVRVGAASKVENIFEQIHLPNVECWTTLIKAKGALGDVEGAVDVLGKMRKERVTPTIRTYNTLIGACVKGGELQKARSLFTEMIKDEVRPNAVSWNILINWHVREKTGEERVEGALQAFSDMKATGVAPNVVTFTTLMKMYTKSGLLNKAEEVFAEMKLRIPADIDITVYNTLLAAYAEKLEWRRCMELLDELDGFYIPDGLGSPWRGGAPAHSGGYARRRPWILEDMKPVSTGNKTICKADAVSFALTVKACAGAGRPDKGREVLDEMMDRGFFPPPMPAVVSLMAGYAKSGRLAESFGILKEAKEWKVYPEERMLTSVMHSCLEAQEPNIALNVWAKFKSGGLKMDVVTGTMLVRAYGMKKEVDIMANVILGMKRKGAGVNVVAYNEGIEWAVRGGRLDVALSLLGDMLEEKIRMNRNTFVAIRGGTQDGHREDTEWVIGGGVEKEEWKGYLLEVMKRVRNAGGVVNGVLYIGLLQSCMMCGDWERVKEIVEIRRKGEVIVGKHDEKAARRLEEVARARQVMDTTLRK